MYWKIAFFKGKRSLLGRKITLWAYQDGDFFAFVLPESLSDGDARRVFILKTAGNQFQAFGRLVEKILDRQGLPHLGDGGLEGLFCG